MAFIVKKKINGKEYFYLNENKRVDGKVKTKTLAYLGKDRKGAEKRAKEFVAGIVKESKTGEKTESELREEILSDHNKKREASTDISIEELATFCKRKGFVYQSGEIYGGLAGFWDFGPLGVELKNNIKKEWWSFFVLQREDIAGIDGSIITNPKVWEASGHVANFVDVFVVNKKTKEKFKVDKFELSKYQNNHEFEVRGEFSPMFTTQVGPSVAESTKAFLRPETAQLIFADFKSVYENSRLKLPCGIAQIGKAFRNEIAPRDFLFRSREFEQMEIEYFINPKDGKCPYEIPDLKILVFSEKDQEMETPPERMSIKEAFENGIIRKDWHAYWLATAFQWFINLGANPEKFRIRQHSKQELSHYSTDTWDLEYHFPFGWKELQGVADRGDYDLSQHEKLSGKDMKIFDEKSKEKVLPNVVCEPSLGVERAFLVFMFDSYLYDKERDNVLLRLSPKLSPIKAAIFPIVKKEEYEKISQEVFDLLKTEFKVIQDNSGSIGRRYARNDEAGTPFCITVDEESLKRKDVTVRDRDTKRQVRVKISEIKDFLRKLIQKGKGLD